MRIEGVAHVSSTDARAAYQMQATGGSFKIRWGCALLAGFSEGLGERHEA